MEEKEKLFSTRDLYLAATLITLKFPHVRTDFQFEGVKSQPIGYFCFENSEELMKTLREYRQSTILVEPKTFINNMHHLKAEVFNAFRNPHNNIS